MINFKKIIIVLFPLLISTSLAQVTHTISVEYKIKKLPFGLTERIPKPMPVVALALSGGGARGLAQIGVLKAIQEARIPVSLIVGTSMGSIVGGLYSAGYSINQLDSIAVNTNWDNLLASDRETNRRELFVDQKITEDKAIFSLRLKGLNLVLPTSLNNGEKLSNYLNILTFQAPIHADSSFDELRNKFRAVCTNLVNGHPVVIGDGSLSQALRASSSVSFFVSPVRVDSLTLVDGGLVANIPVKIAKSLGGQYVIAVNTTSALHTQKELSLPWEIADQVVSIPMKKLNDSELSLANSVISPKIVGNKINDFTHIKSLILSGYKAALPEMNRIKSQIDSLFRKNFTIKKYYLKNIMLTGNESELDKPFIEKYSMKDSVSSYDILDDLYSIYSTGYYKKLSAEVTKYRNYTTIKFIDEKNPIIKRIKLLGVSLISDSIAQNSLNGLVGFPYSAKKVVAKSISLINLYRKQGYSLAEIKKISFDKKNGILSVTVNEGKISSIEILGNKFTNRTIITREIPIKIGDYLNSNNIKQGLTNLRSTNIFDDIYFAIKNIDGRDALIVNVHEKDSSLLRVGFRVDNEDKAQLSLNLVDENLFGTGTELGLLLLGSSRNRSFVIEHKSNRIFDTYLTYKLNAYYKFEDIYNYVNDPSSSTSRFYMSSNGEYRQIYYGGSVSVGTQVERFGNLIFEGKYQVDQVKNINNSPVNPLRATIVSFKASSTVDTQNKYPYPTKGIYFNGNYETAQNVLGGQVGYTNINFSYKNYFTVGSVSTFSPRLTMGFADKTLPLSEEYSLGGQSSFFGMNDNQFRGRQIFLASLEYRYKLPFQIFFDTYFKFRYDLGSTWDEQEEIRFKDLRHGIGATLSFDTPIGPADFSVGRSFLFVKNLPGNPLSWGNYFFYFSIGYYY